MITTAATIATAAATTTPAEIPGATGRHCPYCNKAETIHRQFYSAAKNFDVCRDCHSLLRSTGKHSIAAQGIQSETRAFNHRIFAKQSKPLWEKSRKWPTVADLPQISHHLTLEG